MLQNTALRVEQIAGESGTEDVGEGAAGKDSHKAIEAKAFINRGDDIDHRDENKHLARKRGDDGDPRLINALEELRVGDGKADERRHDEHVAQRWHTEVNKLGIGSKCHGQITGYEEYEQGAEDADGDIALHGQLEDFAQTIQSARAVVISCNRLHTLADAYDKHDDQRAERVGYTAGSYGIIATVMQQLIVEQRSYSRACHIHRERTDADGKDIAEDIELRCPTVTAEADERAFAYKMTDGQNGRGAHRDGGGPGSTGNTQVEHIDEEAIEQDIKDGTIDHDPHGLLGVSRGTDQAGEIERHRGEEHAWNDDIHIFLGVSDGLG